MGRQAVERRIRCWAKREKLRSVERAWELYPGRLDFFLGIVREFRGDFEEIWDGFFWRE